MKERTRRKIREESLEKEPKGKKGWVWKGGLGVPERHIFLALFTVLRRCNLEY